MFLLTFHPGRAGFFQRMAATALERFGLQVRQRTIVRPDRTSFYSAASKVTVACRFLKSKVQ